MVLQTVVEQCLTGLGYELVDLEHGPGGLLRVYIDFPVEREVGIGIEDCERVSHQLSHVLTVENVDYQRLEVSSPGLDRPLRKASDFERFAGLPVTVRLKRPLEGRRNFEGVLTVEPDERFGVEFTDEPVAAGAGRSGGRKAGAAATAAGKGQPGAVKAAQAGGRKVAVAEKVTRKMVFALDEIDRARLVPVVDFHKRGSGEARKDAV